MSETDQTAAGSGTMRKKNVFTKNKHLSGNQKRP